MQRGIIPVSSADLEENADLKLEKVHTPAFPIKAA